MAYEYIRVGVKFGDHPSDLGLIPEAMFRHEFMLKSGLNACTVPLISWTIPQREFIDEARRVKLTINPLHSEGAEIDIDILGWQ